MLLFCGIAVLAAAILLCIIIIPRSNTDSAGAVVSSDYSSITYKGNVYVPIQLEKLPLEVKNIGMISSDDMIKATVENENYFLDKYFFTNYIAVKEYNGEIFIYLETDYDVNESNYYCSQEYKDKVKK